MKTVPSREHHPVLDALRGTAAVLVVVSHSRDAAFATHDLDPFGAGAIRVLLAPASLAQEALAAFFVLSGYLVGGQVLGLLRADRFTWRGYLSRRLTRLWIVLLPALAVTFLVDSLSVSADPRLFGLLSGGVRDAPTAICNAAFLMGGRCPPYGSDYPLWTLGYEFWFYLVFAGAAVTVFGLRRRRGAALGGLVVVVGGLTAFGPDLLRLMPAWLIGALIAEVRHRSLGAPGRSVDRRVSRAAWAVAISILAVGCIASNLLRPTETLRFIVVASAVTPLIWLCASDTITAPGRVLIIGRRLGGWSYSIYAFHRPLVVLMALISAGWWGADAWVSLLVTYLIACLAIAVVYPLSRITERHTDVVRIRLAAAMARVGRRPTETGEQMGSERG